MPAGERLKSILLGSWPGRIAMILPRTVMAFRAAGIGAQRRAVLRWALTSRERVNFTYATTRESDQLLAAAVAEVAGVEPARVAAYLDELHGDDDLIAHVVATTRTRAMRHRIDRGFKPGRRIAFYLLTRALKPRYVVEAGVDHGLGAVLISRALARNAEDGHPGDYLGIEMSATKPIPLYEGYDGKIGRIKRGDSVEILGTLDQPVDLFIHDTTSASAHVEAQLAALQPHLSSRGVIASTWTTDEFTAHAAVHGLGLLTHQEEPVRHWFKGDRVAMLYPRRTKPVAATTGASLWPRLKAVQQQSR